MLKQGNHTNNEQIIKWMNDKMTEKLIKCEFYTSNQQIKHCKNLSFRTNNNNIESNSQSVESFKSLNITIKFVHCSQCIGAKNPSASTFLTHVLISGKILLWPHPHLATYHLITLLVLKVALRTADWHEWQWKNVWLVMTDDKHKINTQIISNE